ncbi:MAG: DUF6063 family protein [Syntrophomonas sp.]
MLYEPEQVMGAFKLYACLAVKGCGDREQLRLYLADDVVRGLVDQFAREVDCTIVPAADQLLLIPLAVSSPFHISNDALKRLYLPGKYLNADIYLMYVAIIVFFGEFYDSYQTTEPTRDFLPLNQWLSTLNQRILALKELDPKDLEKLDREQEYNWKLVVEKWDALNDLKETVKTQDARTISRLSFLNMVKRFLESQDLLIDIGADELALTEKARTIIQRYYMEVEYNRGILEFLYQLDLKKERE